MYIQYQWPVVVYVVCCAYYDIDYLLCVVVGINNDFDVMPYIREKERVDTHRGSTIRIDGLLCEHTLS